MTKIVNGERASYRSPKFAAMQVCVRLGFVLRVLVVVVVLRSVIR